MSEKQFYLLQVNDALFPIGGYSHSQGLETYIQRGIVHDADTAREYITHKINWNLAYTELLGARLAYEAARENDLSELLELEEILEETDAVVIARGDLGQAYPLWELPVVQKKIAAACCRKQIPFMVVTQMLQSMIKNPVPTRAEVMDIYNAVADGAASLMLTGETAVGEYPEEAMAYLVKTAEAAGKYLYGNP